MVSLLLLCKILSHMHLNTLFALYPCVGVAYDIQNNLYFWIIKGGQSPLYRYNVTSQESSTLRMFLDTPVSLAADWVQRRLFWVQDGINVSFIYVYSGTSLIWTPLYPDFKG